MSNRKFDWPKEEDRRFLIGFIIIALVIFGMVWLYVAANEEQKENKLGCESLGGHIGGSYLVPQCFAVDEDGYTFKWNQHRDGRWYKTR